MKFKQKFALMLVLLSAFFLNFTPNTIYADESSRQYTFDVNVIENNETKWGGSEYLTYDVYIDGKLEADDVHDFNFFYSSGIKYEIKDIKVASGHRYSGTYDSPISGVVTGSDKAVYLLLDCNPLTVTFHRNLDSTDKITEQQVFDYNVENQSFFDKKWSKTGYTLIGWNNNKDAEEAEYSTLYSDTNNEWILFNNPNMDLYAVWQPKTYSVTIDPNGGAIEPSEYMTKNSDGTISFNTTYDSNNFYALGISTSREGYTFDGVYDSATDGNLVWQVGGAFEEGKYWDKNGNWIYDGDTKLYCHWTPIDYTMTFDYNKNSELTNADMKSKTVTYDSPYGELPDPGCAGWSFKEWNTKADGSGSTVTKDDICKGDISVYALWSYNPVNVSVPQTLIGDKNGNSEFIVKSDDIESGSIDVTVPDGFYYNQEGKSPVYAGITTDGDSKITKDNTAIKYSIITNGLTAGCWSGTFNINLKLTK